MTMENGKNMGVKIFRTKAFFWDTLIHISVCKINEVNWAKRDQLKAILGIDPNHFRTTMVQPSNMIFELGTQKFTLAK